VERPGVNEHESRAHEATETAGIMSAESSIGVGRGKRLSHDNVVTWRLAQGDSDAFGAQVASRFDPLA